MELTIDDFKKALKGIVEKFSTPKAKFMQDTLTDGTIITYDGEQPMVNMPVFALDQSGNQIPLADGVYTIADDGVVLTVAGGVITDVAGTEAVAVDNTDGSSDPIKPQQNMANPVTQPKAVIESIVKESRFSEEVLEKEFKALKDSIEAIKKENEEVKKANAELTEKFSKSDALNKEMFALVEKMADAPAAEPVTTKKEDNKDKFAGMSAFERAQAKAKELHKSTFNN
jgi:hypothetical protein